MSKFVFVLLLALVGLAWVAPATSLAQGGPVSVVYLQGGGMLRGEIVMDVPGKPLVVLVAGQSVQVDRAQIERIELAAPPPAPPATAPVAPAPVVAVPPPPPPPPSGGPMPLAVDRRGRIIIPPGMSPEAAAVLQERNEVSHSLRRSGFGSSISLMSVGLAGVIVTTVIWRVTVNNQADCYYDPDDIYYYDDCGVIEPANVARVGYPLSAVALGLGGTFLALRIARRKRLQHRLDALDQQLREMQLMPLAEMRGKGASSGFALGAALKATF